MEGKDDRRLWEEEYRRKGRMWRGVAEMPFDIPPGSRVLELGCGSGKTLLSLDAHSFVVGLDFSSTALRICGETTDGPMLVLADARLMPFKDESFDVVISMHLLGHLDLDGRKGVASEIARVLRRGGTVHLCELSTSDLRCGKGERVEEGSFGKGSGIMTHFFTEEEMSHLFLHFKTINLEERLDRKKYGGESVCRGRVICSFQLP